MEELLPKISVLLLILVRISSFFMIVPFYSYRTIPAKVKIAIALVLSWMMYYTMDIKPFEINGDYVLLILKEAVVGLSIGLMAYIIMTAIQIAGGFIDFQMGFAIANVIDPQTGAQTPLMGQFFNTLALLVLIGTNGHHLILDGIYYSYQYIPMDSVWPDFGGNNTPVFIMKTFASAFGIAFQMSIPIVATLFLVDIALGITARTVPQLNIFVVGFPIKIGVSFIVLIVTMSVMVMVMQRLFNMMLIAMREFMALLGGG
ncbi:flagellar type III secretion system protein FliR [Rummeliibacillus sp. G93]|uniref:flagellar biosynthetic protein FliR n=1 Tax=Rummeliibacillus TaxID=648802 RepID=UPI00201C4E84|nr:flagellar biosynthetic protein FliR [Rummeliibacillus sp. G93]UQW98396.1 flagellar type III secretion system protein FliR [Rummeliibacillus sp. G93]